MRENSVGGIPRPRGGEVKTKPFAPARSAARTDRIREILEDLIRQRQSLRLWDGGDERGLLEANRRSIVYWQAELAQALAAEHADGPIGSTT